MVNWRYLANVSFVCLLRCQKKNLFLGLFKNVTFDSRKNVPWKVAPEEKMTPVPEGNLPQKEK